ncbi:unnamed protein product [Phytomonas sp. EM1]|nr:unnamed protein product [Phytomonas sp. EM1]|eukprot:CCW59832.1 unnamed protein product [Phytomonas sp. isolate EM1]
MHSNHDDPSTRPDAEKDSVRVYCRVRPLGRSEISNSENPLTCVYFNDNDTEKDTITWSASSVNTEVSSPGTPRFMVSSGKTSNADSSAQYSFNFSGVFRPISDQKEVYKNVAQPLIADVMQGYNGTIFVYGQTGSGKTHTMFGETSSNGTLFCDSDTTDSNVVYVGVDYGVKPEECFLSEEECHVLREETNMITSKRLGKPKNFEAKPYLDSFSRSRKCINPVVQGDRKPSGYSMDARCEKNTVYGKQAAALSATSPSYPAELHALSESSQYCRQGYELGDATGIVPRAVNDLFYFISHADSGIEFEVRLFLVEIYMEQVIDLLAPISSNRISTLHLSQGSQLGSRSLQVREDANSGSFYVEGCEMPRIATAQEAMSLIQTGLQRRTTAATNMNDVSSRSHCLVNFIVKKLDRASNEIKVGKLFLVDLAGSEKVSRTRSEGLVLEEAKLINKSLLTLSLVIQALTENANHVPYRNSVLTKLLKDSLGGNFRTALVVCCSPALCNAEETLSSLRFGARAKTIQNYAVVNRELIADELKRLLKSAQEEIRKLRAKLQKQRRDHQEAPDADCIRKRNVVEAVGTRGVGMKLTSQRQQTSMFSRQCDYSSVGNSPLLVCPRTEFSDDDDNSNSSVARTARRFHRKVREPMCLNKTQLELSETRDALRDAQEINRTLTAQGDSQQARIVSLEEENMAWQQEYVALRQCYIEQEELLSIAKSQVAVLSRDIHTLIKQLIGNLDSVRRAREVLDSSAVRASASSQHNPVLGVLEGSQIGIPAELSSTFATSPFRRPSENSLASIPVTIEENLNVSPGTSMHMFLDYHDRNVGNEVFSAPDNLQAASSVGNMVVGPLLTAYNSQSPKQSCNYEGEEEKERLSLQTSNEVISFTLQLLDKLGSPFHSVLVHQLGLESSKSTPFHHQELSVSSGVPCLAEHKHDSVNDPGNVESRDVVAFQQKSPTSYDNTALLNEAVSCILALGKRIREMDENFAKETQSRNSVALKLELAEKKLKIRQERIELLNLGMQQESKSSQELRAMLEKERNGHQNLLQVARREAHYWRTRFEELDEQLQRTHKQPKV